MASHRNNVTMPSWFPPGFAVGSADNECPSPESVLKYFAIYNGISIGCYILAGSSRVRKVVACAKDPLPRWKFWSGYINALLQILFVVATCVSIRKSGYTVDFLQLAQLWVLRPRASWFMGNLITIDRRFGFVNGALDNIIADLVLCALGCFFAGRLAKQALTNYPGIIPPGETEALRVSPWYWASCAASLAMMAFTAIQLVWVFYVFYMASDTIGEGEADDTDGLRWLVRFLMPVTCLCSWVIWAAFLYSAPGVYCPGNLEVLHIIWGIAPIALNFARGFVEQMPSPRGRYRRRQS
ncbi:hypothetical protein PRK78_005235 [Emydomyces testavorans]|uniref:Uncharacterized protein n=1 Tax=Emydomyces testavorans TaxID=2070801 RepID=A0AAF0IJB5_9EURO|nr:hypothetical protein PRK78_005235 [Emydomyces testavorans]